MTAAMFTSAECTVTKLALVLSLWRVGWFPGCGRGGRRGRRHDGYTGGRHCCDDDGSMSRWSDGNVIKRLLMADDDDDVGGGNSDDEQQQRQ